MARGAKSPAPNALPKVSFVKVTDEVTQQPPGVHDHIARSYGYNDFNDEFVLPEEHYIRYIEPLESDLAIQVEYDMDEQDQEWLDVVNQERKAMQLDKITYETFEIIMDRLEKEWFDLSKNIPKSDMGLPSEDSTCAVCDDSEGENTNAIVFCDGCNLAVHQDCYGVPYIPEGQWLCRKCTVSPENPVSCILCPNEGGAFKQTVSGDWVHLLCAIWVPETAVANDVFMEPITGVEKISKQRWRLRCSVCDIREGACIQCSKASCFTAFHATCARKEKLLMPMKATQGSEAPTLACYCEKHLPREQQEIRAAALRAQHAEGSDGEAGQANSKSNKTARAYAKTYKPGPPLVPRIIVHRILQYISRIPIRHKAELVQLVCRYWSLKREARRGAPLLKRLHLEPWTALSGSKQQTDEEKVMKLDVMRRLRLDLERVRLLIDVVRHREATKQRQQEQIQLVLAQFFYPHEPALRFAFEKILSHDRQEYFKSPVNKTEVPDYYDIIKNPMCWDTIDRKLDSHEYLDLAQFKGDIELVVSNAMTYNQPSTPFYKTALRIQTSLPTILADLDRTLSIRPTPKVEAPECGQLSPDLPTDKEAVIPPSPPEQIPPDQAPPLVGDLEPPLEILDLLISEELVRQDTDVVMTSAPIQSLLNYEMPNIRPPAPPPPAPKPKVKPTKKKPKYDRKTALERKRLERLRALDSSPGFRAPRTRAAMAAAAAFEAEATGNSDAPGTDNGEPSSASATAEDGAGPSRSERSARKPRRSAVPPSQDVTLAVQDVDRRKSFAMFEHGWILPPSQKRGGRAPVERQPLPPPRKRAKTSHGKSQRSVSASAPTERGSSRATESVAPEQTALEVASHGPQPAPSGTLPSESPAPSHPSTDVPAPPHQDVPVASHAASPIAPVSEPAFVPSDTDPATIASVPETTSVTMKSPSPVPSAVPTEIIAAPASHESAPLAEPASAELPLPEPTATEGDAAMDVDGELPADAAREAPAPGPGFQADVPMQAQAESAQAPEERMQEVEEHALDQQGKGAEEPTEPTLEEERAVEASLEDVDKQPDSVGEGQMPIEVDQEPAQEQPAEQPDEHPTDPEQAPDQPAEESSSEEEDTGPRRIIIIEELDTPATRREKNLRKKLERQAAREAAASAGPSSAGPTSSVSAAPATASRRGRQQQQPQAVAGPSRLPSSTVDDDDEDSDLTDLSDIEGSTQQGERDGEDIPSASAARPGVLQQPEQGPVVFRSLRRAPPRQAQAPPAPAPVVEPGAITVKPGEKLEGGTLVLTAVSESFPWWPAVVFEEDDPEVPESVAARAPPPSPTSSSSVSTRSGTSTIGHGSGTRTCATWAKTTPSTRRCSRRRASTSAGGVPGVGQSAGTRTRTRSQRWRRTPSPPPRLRRPRTPRSGAPASRGLPGPIATRKRARTPGPSLRCRGSPPPRRSECPPRWTRTAR
ncbi:hypothetical protein BD413DRAFT_637686 [Trametes elegans]|nr:hypothetical protein BD413DRAFT_637686 [Trametes elegans]